INPDAGHGGKTQGLCRLDPDFPIKDKIVLADKDGSTEPQFADRAHEFPHMSRSALADFTRRQLQIVKSNAGIEFREGTPEAAKVISFLNDDMLKGTKKKI